MIVQILLLLSYGLVLAVALVVTKTLASIRSSFNKFKKDCQGLPIAPGWSFLEGHLKSFIFKPNVNRELHQYHEKYGKSFGIMYGSQPMVVSIDLDLIKTFAIDEQARHVNRIQMGIPIRELEEDCVLTAEGEQWRRIRRAMAPTFKKSRFMTPVVLDEMNVSVEKLIGAIERKLNDCPGGPARPTIQLDADDFMHRFASDIVLSCIYKQPDVIDFHAEKDTMIQGLDKGLTDVFDNPVVRWSVVWPVLRPIIECYMSYFDPLGVWRSQMMGYVREETELNRRAREEVRRARQTRIKSGNDEIANNVDNFTLSDGSHFTRNMIDYFIDQYHDGKVAEREYRNSLWFLHSAADKTASDVLVYALYQLSINPHVQDKLAESVLIEGDQCEYLTWVVNESLRLMPPAPIGCSRRVERDFKVAGGVVPRGTFVVTPTYVIHRLKEYWGDDANEFKPERFAKQNTFHPCQYLPFGTGSRGCPGKEFAMYEMRLALGKLIARYKFTCPAKANEGFDAPYFIYIIPYEPTILGVSRRL